MKPVIATTAWMEDARWLDFQGKVALLEEAYLVKIERAGGVPVVVPPYPDIADDIVGAIDALVIGGGADVDPARYGEDRHEATGVANDERQDAGEMAIAGAAIKRGIPVLAICRGCQVLNVLYGGALIQDLPEVEDGTPHAAGGGDPKPQTYVAHRVRAAGGSLLAKTLGDEFEVQSWHHQGVGRLGDGLDAVGRADDGLVEAIEDPRHDFVLGVQWHPEVEAGNALFEALVDVAGRPA